MYSRVAKKKRENEFEKLRAFGEKSSIRSGFSPK
jgi:hypothetical protein